MKEKVSKFIDGVIECLCFVVISYALASVSLSFYPEFIAILFFAVHIYTMINFRKRLKDVIENKIVAEIMCDVSVVVFIAIVYFFGYVRGSVVLFSS